MKLFKTCLMVLIGVGFLTGCDQQSSNKRIGIIIPQQNNLIKEMVAGFTNTLHETYHKPVEIKVANIQDNPNVESVIQQMRDENVNIIVAVGTDLTKKTIAITPAQSVISLASDISENDRQKLNLCNLAIVQKTSTVTALIQFIHEVYPTLTHVTLLHSNDQNVLAEVNQAISVAKQNNIKINPVTISSLSKLTSAVKNIPVTTQLIVILKDELLQSGVGQLSKITSQRHIPLISSDSISAQDGANFSLSIPEKEIGIEGAKLAVSIFNNQPACQLPIVEMKKFRVTINEKAGASIALDIKPILDAAQKLNYTVEMIRL